MDDSQHQDVARKLEAGEYYTDARSWYTALYVAPVSERSGFLVIAALAGIVFFIGVLSLVDLMPISERERIIIANPRMDSTRVKLSPLREKGVSINTSMKKFFAANYVYMWESYRFPEYQRNFNFIKEHSDPTAFNQYLLAVGPENPRSYPRILGQVGERTVQIVDIQLNTKVEPNVATVRFLTDFKKVTGGTQSAWTATLSFYYTKVSLNEVEGDPSGESKLSIEDPVFNVVSYSVVPNR